MGVESELVQRAKMIRERLRRPPNAVLDSGINLKKRIVVEQPDSKPLQPAYPAQIASMMAAVIVRPKPPKALRAKQHFQLVLEAVSVAFNVPPDVIAGRSRKHEAAMARLASVYIYTSLGYGPAETGRRFRRDHTTILYSRRRIFSLIQSNEGLKSKIETIIESLKPVLDTQAE